MRPPDEPNGSRKVLDLVRHVQVDVLGDGGDDERLEKGWHLGDRKRKKVVERGVQDLRQITIINPAIK